MQEYEIPKIGSALEEDIKNNEEFIVDESVLNKAHYSGVSEQSAYKIFENECICRTCLHLQICKIASIGIENSLTVISRCLAYIPSSI